MTTIAMTSDGEPDVHCSFCEKHSRETSGLIIKSAETAICLQCLINFMTEVMKQKPGVIEVGMMFKIHEPEKDNCSVCHGERGGVKGNENVMPDGALICDYCHADTIQPNTCECGHHKDLHPYTECAAGLCQCLQYREVK